jgi:hypothetical protein
VRALFPGTFDGQLWEAAPGAGLKVLPETLANPFRRGRVAPRPCHECRKFLLEIGFSATFRELSESCPASFPKQIMPLDETRTESNPHRRMAG